MEQQAIITVKDLRTYFYSDKRCNKVLNGVSFELYKGRTSVWWGSRAAARA